PELVRLLRQAGLSTTPTYPPNSRRGQGEEQARQRVIGMYLHAQDLAENRAARGEATAENRAARISAQTEAEKGRNERAGALMELRGQTEADRKSQGLVTALGQLTPGSAEHKAVLAQYMKNQGIE